MVGCSADGAIAQGCWCLFADALEHLHTRKQTTFDNAAVTDLLVGRERYGARRSRTAVEGVTPKAAASSRRSQPTGGPIDRPTNGRTDWSVGQPRDGRTNRLREGSNQQTVRGQNYINQPRDDQTNKPTT